EEIKRLKKSIPDFSPGDTVVVNVNVVEGERRRSQAFEGMVIAKRNRGLNSSFIVRKISSGEGVERTVQTYSPLIASIEGERRASQAAGVVVIARRHLGLNSSFIVRTLSSGEGVERTFQPYSPLIASIEVKRKGEVRRAKLYYLRERSGKSARIRERIGATI